MKLSSAAGAFAAQLAIFAPLFSAAAQGSLEEGLRVREGKLDFSAEQQIKVVLELPEKFILNEQVQSLIELQSPDGLILKKAELARGSNTISLGDVSGYRELVGRATVYYCEEAQMQRCFLKKPRLKVLHGSSEETAPLEITVLAN